MFKVKMLDDGRILKVLDVKIVERDTLFLTWDYGKWNWVRYDECEYYRDIVIH